ncbi:hypothetical protein [Rhodococcus wratislaviensis]
MSDAHTVTVTDDSGWSGEDVDLGVELDVDHVSSSEIPTRSGKLSTR